jgi:hypothetical protein
VVVPDPQTLGILAATPIQPGQLEDDPNSGMDRIPVFRMKEIDALAEHTLLMA